MQKTDDHQATLEFVSQLCSPEIGVKMGRVDSKFVQSMILGIHRTRSVNLTDIAKCLGENIRLHATHKRLSRNLDNPKLAWTLSQRLLKLGAVNVKSDTRLIVHIYELNKKYARKVEYLPDVGKYDNAGFRVCEVLASNVDGETYYPLIVSVWSERVPGYVSDIDEIKKVLKRTAAATNGRGMFFFDDASFNGDLLKDIITDPQLKFIAMMPNSQIEAVYRNQTWPLQSLADSMNTVYGRTLFKLIPKGAAGTKENTDIAVFIHAGALPIKLVKCNQNLTMIALKSKTRFAGEHTSPMLTSALNLRSRKALMGLVEGFLSLQDVLSVHDSLRESFDPSGFRVLTYDRLQLLMTLLLAVIQYEVSKGGNILVRDHLFSDTPHRGDVNRTYIMPQNP